MANITVQLLASNLINDLTVSEENNEIKVAGTLANGQPLSQSINPTSSPAPALLLLDLATNNVEALHVDGLGAGKALIAVIEDYAE